MMSPIVQIGAYSVEVTSAYGATDAASVASMLKPKDIAPLEVGRTYALKTEDITGECEYYSVRRVS